MDFKIPTYDEINSAAKLLDSLPENEGVHSTTDLALTLRGHTLSKVPEVCTASGIMIGLQIAYDRSNNGSTN